MNIERSVVSGFLSGSDQGPLLKFNMKSITMNRIHVYASTSETSNNVIEIGNKYEAIMIINDFNANIDNHK